MLIQKIIHQAQATFAFSFVFSCTFTQIAWGHQKPCETPLIQKQSEQARLLYEGLKEAASALTWGEYDPFSGIPSFDGQLSVWTKLRNGYPALKDIQDHVDSFYRENHPIPGEALQKYLNGMEFALTNQSPNLDSIQGAMIGSHRLLQYFSALAAQEALKNAPPPPPKKEEKKSPEKEKKEKKPREENKNPSHQPMGERYVPHNKKTYDDGEGDSPIPVSIGYTNYPQAVYLKKIHYNMIYVTQEGVCTWDATPLLSPAFNSFETRSKYFFKMKISDAQKGQELHVPYPLGTIPRTFEIPADQTRVFLDPSQNYRIVTQANEVDIPLLARSEASRPLSPPEIEAHTQFTGTQLHRWTPDLQNTIASIQAQRKADLASNTGLFQGNRGDVNLALVLATYIRKKYLYQVEDDGVRSIYEAEHKGAFQCDIAASIACTILRDEFQIPCDTAGGYIGQTHPQEPGFVHLIDPSTAHAWIMVPDKAGNWIEIDPTPSKKTQEKGTKDEENPFSPKQTSSAEMSEASEEQEGKSGEGTGENDSKDSAAQAETLSQIRQHYIDKKAKETEDRHNANSQKGSSSGNSKEAGAKEDGSGDKKDTKGSDKKGSVQQDFENVDTASANRTILDALRNIENRTDLQMIRKYPIKVILRWIADPRAPNEEKMRRLNHMKGLLNPAGGNAIADLSFYNTLLPAFTEMSFVFIHPGAPLFSRLFVLPEQAQNGDLNIIVSTVHQIRRELEVFLALLEPNEGSEYRRIYENILNLSRELAKVRHKDAEVIRLGIELMENLPGKTSTEILKERYSIGNQMGDDAGTMDLGVAIQKGKENDARLASLLGPHTKFITDPIQIPSKSRMPLWEHSLNPRDPKIFLPVIRPSQILKAIPYAPPGASILESFVRGELYAPLPRRTIEITDGFKDVEPETATVICYDTSGSMGGDPALFQSQYLSAFVDRATSDRSPTGKIRHRVFLIGFDTSAHTAHEVTTVDQARQLVCAANGKTRNTGGGTLILPCLEKAANLLEEAGRQGDKALARATVIVATDGQVENFTKDDVKKKFEKVLNHRESTRTQINFAFVAINGSNPTLMELAEETEKIGGHKGQYIPWTTEDIATLIGKSRVPAKAINDFWTKANWNTLPDSIRTAFYRTRPNSTMGPDFNMDPVTASRIVGDWTRSVERLTQAKASDSTARSGSQNYAIKFLRNILSQIGPSFDVTERKQILAGILNNVSVYFPTPIKDWDANELVNFSHLLAWPEHPDATLPTSKQ